MRTYNTVIIGGGAGGILAGIYLNDKNTILLEKNEILGKKMLMTGGGRCNITNNRPIHEYIKKYYNSGNFYRDAFNTFFNKDIIKLLEDHGCKTKIEDDERVFPKSDKSKTVVSTLTHILNQSNTYYQLNSNVTNVEKEEEYFIITYNNKKIRTKYLIIATGGTSYPETGSTGDGYEFAMNLGHTKTKKMSGLCPIKTKETWVRQLQGITLQVNLEIKANKKSIVKDKGSIIFTHNGISGYVILDNSMEIEKHLQKNQKVIINLDLVQEYNYETLDKKLQDDFSKYGTRGLKRYMHEYLPKNMSSIFLNILSLDETKTLNQITKKERIILRDHLKRLQLTISDVIETQAMVTNSGIKQKEIDPSTFESRIINNLFIVGELIEGCGQCGGYNLQKAFSTGVIAAKTIKERLKNDSY